MIISYIEFYLRCKHFEVVNHPQSAPWGFAEEPYQFIGYIQVDQNYLSSRQCLSNTLDAPSLCLEICQGTQLVNCQCPFHSSKPLSNLLTSKSFSKAALVECITRQPEIEFPRKISSQPLEGIQRKHLIRALTGNFGYIKAVVDSLSDAEPRDSSQHEGFQSAFHAVCRFHLSLSVCLLLFLATLS